MVVGYQHTEATPDSSHADVQHAAEHGESGEVNFVEMFEHTRDSRQLELPFTHVDLPYIFLDNGRLHFFQTKSSLVEAGYQLQESRIVRAGDGTPAAFDLSITKHVVFLWVAGVLLALLAIRAARRNARSLVPSGLGNLMEVFVMYIRDEIVLPNMGRGGLKYLPYLLTTFFFILVMNLLGIVPFGAASSGNINVTAGLAIIAFIMIQYASMRAQGLKHYLAHFTGGAPIWLAPIMVPIEILGLFTKPFALCVRLFANMTGGHLVIISLLGLIFLAKSYLLAPVPVLFALGITMLELLVAVLQAYIFTMLTSLFMGLGIQAGHAAEEPSGGHAHTH
jgi:F-type H+-transporting ATPase subunit a